MEKQRMEMEQIVDTKLKRNPLVLSNERCLVNLTVKVKENDFVFVKDEKSSCRIAKVVHIFDKLAHLTWYIRADELPSDVKLVSDTGIKIKFHKNELIENCTKSKNISLDAIYGKCTVIKAHENDSVAEILQLKKADQMAYVCRYKLVRETIYKLVPVSWLPGEEEMRHAAEMSDFDDPNLFTDTDDQSETVIDLSATINQLHLSLTEACATEANSNKTRAQLVSPIKIFKNEIQKGTRTRNQLSLNKKRSSPESQSKNEDVSPSKKNKLNDVSHILESPSNRSGTLVTPPQCKMNKIKKDLNESFKNLHDELEGRPSLSYKSNLNGLKMTLSKEPLREHNGNNSQSHARTRHSILKTQDSARNTPKQSVTIFEQPKSEAKSKNVIESMNRRTSRRMSSKNASEKISIAAEEAADSSPENKRPQTRKSILVKKFSPPSTPKSRRISTMIAQKTPKTPGTPKTPKGVMTPQQSRTLYRSGNLTPSIQSRQETISGEQSELEMIRERLQVSAVPSSLPCREKEFANIYEFIMGKLTDGSGGCIYISGVPGTGKTATVTQVIKKIQSESKPKKLPAFDYVDINGMRLTEPRQAYVQIYRQLTGKTLAWAQARDLLESRFTAGSKKSIRSTILLVDELDIICNRKQDVVYNLFDWTVRKGSRLIAITIANTMDLPERVLKLKVASRLGLTRITFQPYSFKQLQEVVMTRLAGSNCFMADAVQLVARKVASVSGDCRRALDICRRATEIAEEKNTSAGRIEVNFAHINQALSEMFASPKVRAIKNCTKFEKLFLQAVASEITRTGIEEVEFHRVFWQIGTLAPVLGLKNPPTEDQAMLICMALAANRLLIAEDSAAGLYQKIILNATVDDLYYALNVS